MSKELPLVPALVLILALCVLASAPDRTQMKAYQMREDYGAEPLSDCYLQYYYYIPCPTYSWFWSFSGMDPGTAWGAFFEIGDVSMQTGLACDPEACHTLETIRILDFSGYGTAYPGWWTVQFDVYCSDEQGCPVGPSLWSSPPWDFHFAWNYIDVDPPLCLTPCCTIQDPVPSAPRILVTATKIGILGLYPQWGLDNVSTAVEEGCVMHDVGCMPALYPRPTVSNYSTVHSGYYGTNFEHCPPMWICDGIDFTEDCSQFGYLELTWRIYLGCTGPTAGEPTTWSNIKSMYR